MFEVFLVLLAVAIQSADPHGRVSTGSVSVAAPAIAPQASQAAPTAKSEAAPAFLSPAAKPAAEAVPVFLSPPKPRLVAEPQVATGKFTTALEVKPILNATRTNWIAVREFDGQDLLYVTHLWAWRCGLLELRIGINGADPQSWPVPDCHLDQPAPNAILEGDGVPYGKYGLGSVAMIEVHLTYDDLTTDRVKFNRQGVPIP